MEKIASRYFLLFISVIVFIAFAIRFYQLSSIPNGLYQDETALGYNAFSILTTGMDEHGARYPFYFKSFGDHKLPVYFYITALSIKAFGINEFAVRFPSALLGVCGVFLLILLVKKLTNNYVLALISGLLLAITPWHIHFSRAAFEVNIALTFALFGTFMFISALNSKRQLAYLLMSVLGFTLSMYSYNVTRLFIPLLIVSLILIYKNEVKKIKRANILFVFIFTTILLIPFIATFLTRGGVQSAGGALITSKDIEAKILEQRSYLLINNYPEILLKLFFNKYIMIMGVYLENLASILNSSFLFVKGSAHGNQGIGNFGPFLLSQVPFFLYGLYKVLRVEFSNFKIILLWFVISFLILGLSKEVPHATRGYFLVIPITVMSAVGIAKFIDKINNGKLIINNTKGLTVILFLFSINFFYYATSYIYRFPIEYAKSWRSEDKELVEFLVNNENDFDKIIIDSKADFIYTSYLYYSKYDPIKFQTNSKRLPDDTEGFSKVLSFGKFEYKDVDWTKDYKQPKTLIITTESNKPKEIPAFQNLKYPQRPVVVSLKEEIYEYPVTDNAYVLVK